MKVGWHFSKRYVGQKARWQDCIFAFCFTNWYSNFPDLSKVLWFCHAIVCLVLSISWKLDNVIFVFLSRKCLIVYKYCSSIFPKKFNCFLHIFWYFHYFARCLHYCKRTYLRQITSSQYKDNNFKMNFSVLQQIIKNWRFKKTTGKFN